ncbi:hypothetical protein [Sphingomonas sp. LY160]|uniref:hypothetical protein n=1 Tax=Sphingomonas sp. LY160 TaxID=3095342 RepID=UPI002ADEF991|nr:hypothetical protein [Sphingomonas sp. LY160]MEA1071290.1 hypothetical protein [Sphingomonas sp. LY160]
MSSNNGYYQQRLQEERAREKSATDGSVRAAHRAMAERYQELISTPNLQSRLQIVGDQ